MSRTTTKFASSSLLCSGTFRAVPRAVISFLGHDTSPPRGFGPIVERSDVHDSACTNSHHLPPLDRSACSAIASYSKPDEEPVFAGKNLDDVGTDAGVASSLIPAQYLLAVLAARRVVVGSSPLHVRVKKLGERVEVGASQRRFDQRGNRTRVALGVRHSAPPWQAEPRTVLLPIDIGEQPNVRCIGTYRVGREASATRSAAMVDGMLMMSR